MAGTSNPNTLTMVLGLTSVAFLAWAIAMTVKYGQATSGTSGGAKSMTPTTTASVVDLTHLVADKAGDIVSGANVCAEKALKLPKISCFEEALDDGANVTVDTSVVQAGPQAGANVTLGYQGEMDMSATGLFGAVVPITDSYYTKGLCPVNVHWHLGAEHYSAGEYDCEDSASGWGYDDTEHRDLADLHSDGHASEDGANYCGPSPIAHRRLAAGKTRKGYQCNHYDKSDPKFTTPYEWKFCDQSMEVGQTYEVHWPHSSAGACHTPSQYQTPFYDGVFCNLDMATLSTLQAQDIANNVGVQAQVFTVVNDENYYVRLLPCPASNTPCFVYFSVSHREQHDIYHRSSLTYLCLSLSPLLNASFIYPYIYIQYPNLMRGMIVDGIDGFGTDMAIYTGSTTGSSVNNELCSSYTPITWQVDRKCHLISASSFDKMCADMASQRDDMTDDMYAHGARALVADVLAANNQVRGRHHA